MTLGLAAFAKQYGAPDEVIALIATGKPLTDLLRADAVGAFFSRFLGDRDQAAFAELVRALSQVGNYDPIEAEVRLYLLLSKCTKEQGERLNEAFQTMFFGRSRAAWPYVAMLTADRIVNHDGRRDTFSRRAGWLLQRCEEEDVELLRDLAQRTAALFAGLQPDDRVQYVRWYVTYARSGEFPELPTYLLACISVIGEGSERPSKLPNLDQQTILRAVGLFRLLVESRLASESVTDEPSAQFDYPTDLAERLVALFRNAGGSR